MMKTNLMKSINTKLKSNNKTKRSPWRNISLKRKKLLFLRKAKTMISQRNTKKIEGISYTNKKDRTSLKIND